MATSKKQAIREGNLSLRKIAEEIASLARNNPLASIDGILLEFHDQHPELEDKTKCPNCESSMLERIYEPTLFHGLLLLAMAREVRSRQEKGATFTDANNIHIPTLATTDAIRHSITQASYLNLVAQQKKAKNSGIGSSPRGVGRRSAAKGYRRASRSSAARSKSAARRRSHSARCFKTTRSA